jgi:prepilin-type processing-associated H-X9-DG protein
MVHDTYGQLPGGGWAFNWVGDATRDCGPRQPGGWIFQILPFLEQQSLYRLAIDIPGVTQMVATPVPTLKCPSRRGGGPYPNSSGIVYRNYGGFTAPLMARSDYAASSGDQPVSPNPKGPTTLAQGDNPNFPWPDTSVYTGVVFQRSTIALTYITNGTSNTFLAGDKYLNPNNWTTGRDGADNEGMYIGMDDDVTRGTFFPPQRDQPGISNGLIFGSNHPGGVNMLYCDGAVQHVSYTVDRNVFRRSGNRK